MILKTQKQSSLNGLNLIIMISSNVLIDWILLTNLIFIICLEKPKQLSQVCIEKGYIIDFEKMIQFKADDPEK